jgi:hypothetical protein
MYLPSNVPYEASCSMTCKVASTANFHFMIYDGLPPILFKIMVGLNHKATKLEKLLLVKHGETLNVE